jgi:hypothetical protein
MAYKLTVYDYTPNEAELLAMSEATRKHAARTAKIDSERLSVRVVSTQTAQINDNPLYCCQTATEVKLDGRDLNTRVPEERQIYFSVRNGMCHQEAQIIPDPSRLRLVQIIEGPLVP